VASKKKPVLLATGAATMTDVEIAVDAVLKENRQLCLMQCNTNYTGSLENFRFVNLKVLQTYALHWPGLPLGLSDHTPEHATVLGAVALGARAIEKHFTDDTTRSGPDHPFSMTPATWRAMVDRTRELENAMGDGVKRIEPNEMDSAIVQRRCLRLKSDLPAGSVLEAHHVESLRPAPRGAYTPAQIEMVIGKRLRRAMPSGSEIAAADLEA
jgi:N-acetylneuraminate synthase